MPQGTIIRQKRLREDIDTEYGVLTLTTNKRRRLVKKGASIFRLDGVKPQRDVVANILFRPASFPSTINISVTQGQLFDRSIQSIPRISISPILPLGSRVFTIIREGQLDELRALLDAGKASIRDHDERGDGLLHVGRVN